MRRKFMTSQSVMLATLIILGGTGILAAAPYQVDAIGDWSGTGNPDTALSVVMQQQDVAKNGIQLATDLSSPTWTNWQTGTTGGVILSPLDISGTLSFDLNSFALAGTDLSFVTSDTGALLFSNGLVGSTDTVLSFGVDGRSTVSFENVGISAGNIFINSSTNAVSDINFKDSTITLAAGGTFAMSGQGRAPSGYPTNSDGLPVDENGNVVNADYYHHTALLDGSSLQNVNRLTITDGAALKLINGSVIQARDISITGAGRDYSSALRGSGTLAWSGDMEVSGGAIVDFSDFAINGEAAGDLYVGKSAAQNLLIKGGKVPNVPGSTGEFIPTEFTIAGVLTADNASRIRLEDSARLNGVSDIDLLNGSKMKLTGQLAYNHQLGDYIGPALDISGDLNVSGSSVFAMENAWQVNVAQDARIDNGAAYVGVDLAKDGSEQYGQGVLNRIATRLAIGGTSGGLLTVGGTSSGTSRLVIQGGASVSVQGDAVIGDGVGSSGVLSVDEDFSSSGAPASNGSSLNITGDLVAGRDGHAGVNIGAAGKNPDASITAGSTVLAQNQGSTAIVRINAESAADSLQYFYNPRNYAWAITGQGETDRSKLVSAGDSSLIMESGLMFINSNGVFSMGGQDGANADYLAGNKGAYGVAHFSGGGSELRLNKGSFVNAGAGANSGVGKVIFENGAVLSGQGSIYAGESIQFKGAVLEPGSRFLYDDRITSTPIEPPVIGHLDMYLNNPGGIVSIDGNSKIRVAFTAPGGEGGKNSDVTIHNGNVSLSEGFVVDMYRIYEGSYRILNTTDGTIGGSYSGYSLQNGDAAYFALNGNPLALTVSGTALRSNRVLQGIGDISTRITADKKELWVDLSNISTAGNIHTYWTGASSNTWNMYAENWDATTTNNTKQYLDGDIVTFQGNPANRDVVIQTYGKNGGLTLAGMNVLGDSNWSFSGEGITAYNSELYTTLKLEDPNPDLRPTGRLLKKGSGTLTINNANEFFGGVHFGDHNEGAVGGVIVLNNEKALGTYNLSGVERGLTKGTVFMHSDGTIETTANVNNIQNRFYVEDGNLLRMIIANDSLGVRGNASYGLSGELGAVGGAAFYVSGTVIADKHIVLSNNRALSGGSLYLAGYGDFIAPGLTVNNSYNSDANSGGGGIYFAGTGSHSLANLTLTGNDSIGYGGGLYIRGDDSGNAGTLTLSGNTLIRGNRSTLSGGGIYIEGSGNDGHGVGNLVIDTTLGDVKFESNLSDVQYTLDDGSDSLNPTEVVLDTASSNAIDVYGGSLTLTGSNTVFFYDPITGTPLGTTMLLGANANDTVTAVFHGHSRFGGNTTVAGQSTLRLEYGDFIVRGNQIKNGLAGYGVSGPVNNGVMDENLNGWTVWGDTFELQQNARITGMGVIGARNGIKLDGILNLDAGSAYDPLVPFTGETTGTLSVLGNATLAKTAVWDVTLDKGAAAPSAIRNSDRVAVYGSATFTDAAAKDNLTVNIGDLVRGKYMLMSSTDGIINFNTDKKKSGAAVLWNYGAEIIDITNASLTGAEDGMLGRVRASTYVENNNLYLDIAARNRHVLATQSNGTWSDNGLWEYNTTTHSPSGGSLSYNWQKNDAGPDTNVFLNGDMVTFSPASGTFTYNIGGTVRPVDMFVSGNGNIIFTGGNINTYSTTAAADLAATSINPVGGSGTNDYGIANYTGRLLKTDSSTLTFRNGGNTFAGGIVVGDIASGAAGGVIEFTNGNQLSVGGGANMRFAGDGTLRNLANTTLGTAISIDAGKTATFDIGTGLALTKNGQISGQGTLEKTGRGRLILTSNNPFSGGVLFGATAGQDAGTIEVRADNALGAAYTGAGQTGVVSVIGTGTLTHDNNTRTLRNRFTVESGGALTIHTTANPLVLSSVNAGTLNGGAIVVDAGAAAQFAVDGNGGLQISGNRAANGGGLYTAHTGDMDLSGATGSFKLNFANNQATAGSGGAIYSAANILAADGGQLIFTSNTASLHGGAIYAGGKKVTLVNTSTFNFTGNRAAGGSGGAIYAQSIDFSNNGTGAATITGNSAADKGGAFYIDGGLLSLSASNGDIRFSGNTAGANGGEAAYIANTGGAVAINAIKDVYFYDTLVSDSTAAHSLLKTGTGALMFGSLSGAGKQSAYYGAIDVQSGDIRVTKDALLGVNAADTTFNLAAGAYLTGGGTIAAGNSTLSGILSADTDSAFHRAGSTHTYFNSGTLTFDGNVNLLNTNIILDMQAPVSGGLDGVGRTDQLFVTGTLNAGSRANLDLYSFGFGQYLVVNAGAEIGMSAADINNNFTFTVHGEELTDRHTVNMYRGDDAAITAAGANDAQLWLKTIRHSLLMYWAGNNSGTWNPYDPNNLSSENWTNLNMGSGKIAEGHVRNIDTVYFGDNAYDYAASSLTGPAVTRSDITISSSGVVVTDMIVNNDTVNYAFTGGAITTSGTYEGTLLYNSGTSPRQSLVKQGAGSLAFGNTTNTFSGTLFMQGGTLAFTSANNNNQFGALSLEKGVVNLANTGSNAFAGGIIYQGSETDSRLINFTTAAQLSANDIVFLNSGSLHSLDSVELGNAIDIETGATATLQVDAGKIVSTVDASDISGQGNLVKTGSGILQIASSSANALAGNTDITAGTFRLAPASAYGVATSGTFRVATGATLAGSGILRAQDVVLNGTITPDSAVLTPASIPVPAASQGILNLQSQGGTVILQGITYEYDMGTSAASNLGTAATGDLIKITDAGTVILNGANTLNLTSGSLSYGDYYLLVDSNTTITSDGSTPVNPSNVFGSITQNDAHIEPRIGRDVIFGANSDASINNKQLWLAVSRNTLDMTWSASTGGAWNTTDGSWISSQDVSGLHSNIFNNGDYVHFTDSSGTAAKTITLAADAYVSGIEVNSSGDYSFEGTGGIHGILTDVDYITGKYINDGSIVPDGDLRKSGAGTLTVNNGENTFAGELLVNSGTLLFTNAKNTFDSGVTFAGGLTSITSADQIIVGAGEGIRFTGDATLHTGADMSLDHLMTIADGKVATLETDNHLTITGSISDAGPGAGSLAKTGTGMLTLTTTNSYSGGSTIKSGTLEIAGNAATAGAAGSTVDIASDAAFLISTQPGGVYTLDNIIRDGDAGASAGTMIVNSGGQFLFGSNAIQSGVNGASFSGTVELHNVSYAIDASAESFFSGSATLVTKEGSFGTVTPNGGNAWDMKKTDLVMGGGTVRWTFDVGNNPEGTISANNITALTSASTTLEVMLPDSVVTPTPGFGGVSGTNGKEDGRSIFSFQQPFEGTTLLLADSQTDISGLRTDMLHVDLYVGGVKQINSSTQTITNSGLDATADGIFDWGAYVTNGTDARVGYILRELQVYDGQTLYIDRTGDDGKVFGIKITDKTTNGSVMFSDESNAMDGIILNSQNSYTGATYITNDTVLTAGVDYVFGTADKHTSGLYLGWEGSRVNLGDTTQYAGGLNIGSASFGSGTFNFDNGTLNLSESSVSSIEGDNALIGGGTLNIGNGSLVFIDGSNGSLSTNINSEESTIRLTKTDGLGNTGTLSMNDGTILIVAAQGDFAKILVSDTNALFLTGSQGNINLTGDNSAFRGGFAIATGGTLTAGEAKNIGLGKIGIANGTFVADNSADWTLDPANQIIGAGTLRKQNSGELAIVTSNTLFSGTTSIVGGSLKVGANEALGSSNVINNAKLELAGGVTAFANNISGTGVTLITSEGVNITGGNTGFASTGRWEVAGSGTVSSQANLGDAALNISGSIARLSVRPAAAGDFTLVNALTGEGTLDVRLTGTADNFSMASSAGTDFTGTLALQDSSFVLGGTTGGDVNAAALTNATLQSGSGSVTNVAGNATIGGLVFDGGRVKFDVELPPDSQAAGVLDASAKGITITSNAGSVGISSDLYGSAKESFDNPVDPAHERNLLDQDNIDLSNPAHSDFIKLATGHVDGSANSLKLVDASGVEITDNTLVDINEAGELAAIGTYDYSLATDSANNDLYVGYLLTQLDLQQTGEGKALTLSSAGAANDTLSARVTGSGNLAIEAGAGRIVLSNGLNDYTGETVIKSGTLVAGVDNALGGDSSHTKKLTIETGAAFDLNDKTQVIDAMDNKAGLVTLGSGTLTANGLVTSTNGLLDLGDGTLKINAGGRITGAGSLIGSTDSLLHVDPSVLTIDGANVDFHGHTLIEGGSTIALDHVYGLGDGLITIQDADDTLSLVISDAANAGAAQPLLNTLEGAGVLSVTATVSQGGVYIDTANVGFTGTTRVEHGDVIVSHIDGVGSSFINVANEDSLFTWQSVSGTIANRMTGAGTIIFDDSNVEIVRATTAAAYEINNSSKLRLSHANGLGTTQASVNIDATSQLLFAVNAQLGKVTNSGLLAFEAPAAPTGLFKQATLTELHGNGSLLFNVNFATIESDYLTIMDGATGTQTVLVNRVGEIPATGSGIIPIIETKNFIADADAFKLLKGGDGKEIVEVGSFAYTLHQGDGTEKIPNPAEWYLVGDSPSKLAEVVVNTASGMGMMWHAEMDALIKRMGDLRLSQQRNTDDKTTRSAEAWIRGYGWKMNADGRVAGEPYTEYYYGTDVGVDKSFRIETNESGGLLYTGLFIGAGRTDRKFNGFGDGNTDMYRGGFYVTYMHDSGWYSDIVGKVGYYDSTFDSISVYGDRAHGEYHQWGAGLSWEVGKQFIKDNGAFWEPQFQVSYGHIWGNHYTAKGTFPVRVTVEKQDSWQGRAGFRFGKNIETKHGRLSPYGKAFAVNMRTDGGRVRTSDGISASATLDGVRLELGAGLAWQTLRRGQFYLDYEYIRAPRFDIPWKVNGGWRVQW